MRHSLRTLLDLLPSFLVTMPRKIDTLLKSKDDNSLCDALFAALVAHYGGDLDISKCKQSDQVVLLAWNATGIIDNGGFQYLLESKFKGDPHFTRTAAAYKAIKADKCAAAFAEVLALFSESKPPADIETRLKLYQSVSTAKRKAFDNKFFDQSKAIAGILGRYIRDNRDAFTHL